MLLNLVVGSSASASSVLLSHQVAFWVTVALGLLNVALLYKDRPRGPGPLLLTLFAVPLVMLNPTVNLMQDRGSATSSTELNNLLNIVTWIGVIEMTVAAFWNGSLDRKVRRRCCPDLHADGQQGSQGRPGHAPDNL